MSRLSSTASKSSCTRSPGRTAVDRMCAPFRSRAKHKNMAVFQPSSSHFKCLFNQRKIVPAFFISFGTPALTSLLPTDLFAEILGSDEKGKKKKRITHEAILSEPADVWLQLEPTPGGCGSHIRNISAAVQSHTNPLFTFCSHGNDRRRKRRN